MGLAPTVRRGHPQLQRIVPRRAHVDGVLPPLPRDLRTHRVLPRRPRHLPNVDVVVAIHTSGIAHRGVVIGHTFTTQIVVLRLDLTRHRKRRTRIRTLGCTDATHMEEQGDDQQP